jgi:hypothetical protein
VGLPGACRDKGAIAGAVLAGAPLGLTGGPAYALLSPPRVAGAAAGGAEMFTGATTVQGPPDRPGLPRAS